MMLTADGETTHAIGINGTVPAPLLRLKEGQNVRLSVTNQLDEDSSIHWHGLLVPFPMDGVPGASFPGIRPGETRSEESRVGDRCVRTGSSRWSPYHYKKHKDVHQLFTST